MFGIDISNNVIAPLIVLAISGILLLFWKKLKALWKKPWRKKILESLKAIWKWIRIKIFRRKDPSTMKEEPSTPESEPTVSKEESDEPQAPKLSDEEVAIYFVLHWIGNSEKGKMICPDIKAFYMQQFQGKRDIDFRMFWDSFMETGYLNQERDSTGYGVTGYYIITSKGYDYLKQWRKE